MGAWIKFFKDGPSEHGSDIDIAKGRASWSRGRLDSITAVQLFDNTVCLDVRVPNTSWHQYDRYLAFLGDFGENASSRSARVVQAEIKHHHVGQSVRYMRVNNTSFINMDNSQTGKIISSEDVGLWITGYILSNGKTGLEFCRRGAFNGDKQILK